jgi:nucleoid-associated protein YgaU
MSRAAYDSDYGVETRDEGPYRFLRFAASAGAAAVAAGGAALAWRKSHGGAPDDLLNKLGPDAPAASAAGGLNQDAFYEVQKGENLSSIARKLGSTVEVLKESNSLQSDTILPGQKLWVPKTHTIQKGDTLSKIANQYGTSVGDVMKVNSISDPDKIFPGDILLLP